MRSTMPPSRSTRGASRSGSRGRAASARRRRRGRGRGLSPGLSLWRGPAFADVTRTPAVAAEADRLDELRLVATELRIEAELAAGRDGTVVPELRVPGRREPVPRTPTRRADARALSVRAADRGARRLSRRPPPARRGARARPGPAPATARTRDPRSGRRSRWRASSRRLARPAVGAAGRPSPPSPLGWRRSRSSSSCRATGRRTGRSARRA